MQTPPAPDQQQLPQPHYAITDADRKRIQRITEAWTAYNGDFTPPLQKMPGQPDDNVIANRCAQIVNTGVDFLFGKELEITLGDDATDGAQDFINSVWGTKETRIPLLQKLAMNGAMAGNAFLRIVTSKNNNFRLVVLDPATVFVQTAPQDCETITLFCIQFEQDQMINGKMTRVQYREEISRIDPSPDDNSDGYEDVNADGLDSDVTWSIGHWTRQGDRGPWTPAGDPIVWDCPYPPVFTCQNLPRPNDAWGTPDITSDLIGQNNALNLLLSNTNRVEKLFGQPILYATGVGEGDIMINPGYITKLPTTESKIGAVVIASDTANALQLSNDIRFDMDERASVPGVATGRVSDVARGVVSGVALALMFMPLLKKTDKKQCLYGEMIIDVTRALLMLNGMQADVDVTLNWQSPLPDDNLPDLQGALVKKELGVSGQTLLSELGYDAEEEKERNKEEDAQKLLNFSQGQGMPPMPQALPGAPPLPGQPPAVAPAAPGQPPSNSAA